MDLIAIPDFAAGESDKESNMKEKILYGGMSIWILSSSANGNSHNWV